MKLYKYRLSQDYTEYAGLDAKHEEKLGVVAQELKALVPEAVTEAVFVLLLYILRKTCTTGVVY